MVRDGTLGPARRASSPAEAERVGSAAGRGKARIAAPPSARGTGSRASAHAVSRSPSAAGRPAGNGRRNRNGLAPAGDRNRRNPRSCGSPSGHRQLASAISSSPSLSISPTSASAKIHCGFLGSRGSAWTRARREEAALGPRSQRAVARGEEGARCRSAPAAGPPLSLIPTRLALPITALRDGAPSASAIALALLP